MNNISSEGMSNGTFKATWSESVRIRCIETQGTFVRQRQERTTVNFACTSVSPVRLAELNIPIWAHLFADVSRDHRWTSGSIEYK